MARGILAVGVLALLVVGIPWGLARYVGWPLPRRLPRIGEVVSFLASPLSTGMLLDALECALWVLWAAFAAAVLNVLGEAACLLPRLRTRVSRTGPLRVLAAALVSGVVLALTPTRDLHWALAVQKHPLADSGSPNSPWEAGISGRSLRGPDGVANDTNTTVVVRTPRNGIHDSLWRIAERRLGDGSLWPQIFELNRNRTQPDGGALTHPNLIQPGWILRLPVPSAPTPDDDHAGQKPGGSPNAGSPLPSSGSPTPTEHSASSSATNSDKRGNGSAPGVSLPDGALVGLGLATAIVVALVVVRRRRRMRYRPGSGRRDDVHFAPVIRALRQAQEKAPDERETPSGAPVLSEFGKPTHVVGAKEGRALAWDLARTRGLGLVGPGALDAARALLVQLLGEQRLPGQGEVELVVPAPDVSRLLGREASTLRPMGRLRVVADQDEALNVMEGELLSRARARHGQEGVSDTGWTELVLVATAQAMDERRLQAVLDNGSTLGMAGILIGQWPSGTTLRIREDGSVAVAVPADSEGAFAGARLFRLSTEDAGALVELLIEAEAATSEAQVPEPIHRHPTPEHPPDEEAVPRSTAQSHEPVVQVSVLGAVCLRYVPPDSPVAVGITNAFAHKQRELMAFLSLRQEGARRETVAATLWPQAPHSRPYNSLHATLSQVRRALRTVTHGGLTDVTVQSDSRYALDKDHVVVDLWEFRAALALSRQLVDDEERASAALHQAVDLYTGDFAEDVSAEWAETPREALRRDFLDAVSAVVRHVSRTDPRQALHLLERARERDTYNEAIYRDIARLQAQLGLLDAVRRTLELLKRSLAEIEEEPSPSTIGLCEALLRGHGGVSLRGDQA
ncbi:BTAD domain-containing putative transcriptional regulator [Streptomyces coacervatus]|uniref:BTAD domain-containing putative transcriptional regulator n=1 Tax=Streptomyces coacervatus TaxID=647381 RepID=UPI0023D9D49F|nr:BTAD domain-containing putative transcriptional regulator [Streptomyces coacervatus]MDF2270294.1 BTAD domain-containing putative transcriptional regulator [Streptomyces coacervatus]